MSKNNFRIQDIMSDAPVTVDIDDNLAVVKSLFEQHHFHHLLVIENEKLCGVISDRDLFKSISHNLGTAAERTSDLHSLNKRVHQVMSRNLVTVTADLTPIQAVVRFNQHRVSCLPVVNEKNQPIGMLSWRDIMKALESKARGEV